MREFENIESLEKYLETNGEIHEVAIQALDLNKIETLVCKSKFECCIFLGCEMNSKIRDKIIEGNYIFPKLNKPFLMYPNKLYDKDSLFNGFEVDQAGSYKNTYDKIVYDHFMATGKSADRIDETLARRMHDHSITDALEEFLEPYDDKQIVAIMGGHGLLRGSDSYRQVAEISKELSETGYLMVSGGGPGAMEATHVGAWFSGQSKEVMHQAMDHLATAPKYDDPNWLTVAFEIINQTACGAKSLGIPTWFYGHEPPTPFASHIAKYFANSVREEGLLAIAKGGVVFAPGSAGTMQEIFQDIAQNHYKSFGIASPMVFLDKTYWTESRPVYTVIKQMHEKGVLDNLNLGIYDDNEEVIQHIKSFNEVLS